MSPYKFFLKCEDEGMSIKAGILLDMISLYKEIPITEVMQNSLKLGLASPATTHRDLHWLIDNHYIRCHESPLDKRIKLCNISSKGRKFLS